MVDIGPPVIPWRGTRDTDAYGSGTFMASRDGGKRAHRGRDYVTVPGDPIVSPIDGIVTRRVVAYAGAELLGLEIESDRVKAKMLYLDPAVDVGQKIVRGQLIGVAQDVSAYWARTSPRTGRMVNHVHLEVSVWIDPTDAMEIPPSPGIPA